MPPFFSIVIAVHNAQPYLNAAISSLLDQTFSDYELIVVDDHSTDGTRDWLSACRDVRLTVIDSPFKGQTPALNVGLKAAQGQWIARMDGDDWCAPHRLALQKAAIDQAARPPVLITSDYWICDENLNPTGLVQLAQPNPKLRRYLETRNNPICHPTVVFHRETALSIGGYDERLRNAQDIRLWHALLARGDWAHVSVPLVKYRVLRGSLSVRFQPEQKQEKMTVLAGEAPEKPNSAPRLEANPAQSLAIYHYKLGFAAWLEGRRWIAWKHFLICIRHPTAYAFKASACLILTLLPRGVYLAIAGYKGVYT